jgi:hypothetical protein
MFSSVVRVLLCISTVAWFGPTNVFAEGPSGPTTADRLELVGLASQQPRPDAPSNGVRFQATVNYQLQSSPAGQVLLFSFRK